MLMSAHQTVLHDTEHPSALSYPSYRRPPRAGPASHSRLVPPTEVKPNMLEILLLGLYERFGAYETD